jgi:hypothetical protein
MSGRRESVHGSIVPNDKDGNIGSMHPMLGLASATHAEPALRRQTPLPSLSLSRTNGGRRRETTQFCRRTNAAEITV